MPPGEWSSSARSLWRLWWRKPQAVIWERTGSGDEVARLLFLWERVYRDGPSCPPSVHAQIGTLADKLGMTPKAMLQLRWRIAEDEVEEEIALAVVEEIADYRDLLEQ